MIEVKLERGEPLTEEEEEKQQMFADAEKEEAEKLAKEQAIKEENQRLEAEVENVMEEAMIDGGSEELEEMG